MTTVAEALAAERKAYLKIQKARAKFDQARRARFQAERDARPLEPCDRSQPTIITFEKTFGRTTGVKYTYAAIRIAGGWFLTGRQAGDPTYSQTWTELVSFMGKDEGDRVAKVYESITVWKQAQGES